MNSNARMKHFWDKQIFEYATTPISSYVLFVYFPYVCNISVGQCLYVKILFSLKSVKYFLPFIYMSCNINRIKRNCY